MHTQIATTLLAHPYWGGGGFHWWFPIFPIFGFLLFWLVIGLVLRGLWWRRGGRGGWGGYAGHDVSAGAENVLGQRFAQGEIDEQEYRARLEVLRAAHR